MKQAERLKFAKEVVLYEIRNQCICENDTIIKTCEAHTIDLEFGTIRSLMKLLNVDNVNDTGELLNIVYGAWEQLVEVLENVSLIWRR